VDSEASTIYNRLYIALLRCGPFENDDQLRAVFAFGLVSQSRLLTTIFLLAPDMLTELERIKRTRLWLGSLCRFFARAKLILSSIFLEEDMNLT
jgi:hypothetical protein